MEDTAAIVLSAGFSSRMGEFKPLMKIGDNTLLERAVKLFREAGIKEIIVVTGYRAGEVSQHIAPLNVRQIVNDRFAEGMYSSITAGLAGLDPQRWKAFFLLPTDIPLVKPSTVIELLQARKETGRKIIYPVFRARRGHPPLISTCYRNHILASTGVGGLKAVLAEFEQDALDVVTRDENVLLDMNTAADYEKLLSRWRVQSVTR